MLASTVATQAYSVAISMILAATSAPVGAPRVSEPRVGATKDATPPAVQSLTGTTWSGRDSDGDDYVFHFQPGGLLKYTSPTGTFDNGTWKQTGNKIYFEMNKKFSEYEGTIQGATITGRAWNVRGNKWTWNVRKNN